MASKKNKQANQPRLRHCPKCNETKEMQKVMYVGAVSGFRDRCNSCSSVINVRGELDPVANK